MKIQIDLKRPGSSSGNNQRTEVYIWKNLNHLKSFYTGIVDPGEIDNIAGKLIAGAGSQGDWKFRERAGLGEVLNESCLCNMVEIMLLEKQDVLTTFLSKPVEFNNLKESRV